jgi:hypothetical protein
MPEDILRFHLSLVSTHLEIIKQHSGEIGVQALKEKEVSFISRYLYDDFSQR